MFGQETVQDTSTKRKSAKRVKKKTHRLSALVAALASKKCSKNIFHFQTNPFCPMSIILHFLILCVVKKVVSAVRSPASQSASRFSRCFQRAPWQCQDASRRENPNERDSQEEEQKEDGKEVPKA